MAQWGAGPNDWRHFTGLGLTADLLPVVSNPHARISPRSSLKALGKTPSRYNTEGEVVGIAKWTEARSRESAVLAWAQNQNLGICIQTRCWRAIDIDVPDAGLAQEIEGLAVRTFGPLPARERPGTGKRLLVVACEGEIPKRVVRVDGGAVELLGNGQQFVAVGTHPSGDRYVWRDGLPNAPVVALEQIDAFWSTLELIHAVEDSVTSRVSERKRGEGLDVADPVADWLEAGGLALGEDSRGAIAVACPWGEQHTSGEDGDGSTVWFRAGTSGYDKGHFRCLHAHCEGRNDGDFFEAVGYREDVSAMFDVIEPDELPERPRFEVVAAGAFSRRKPPLWLVKGVVPKSDLMLIYGASGAGKSFVASDLTLAMARGVAWRGRKVRQSRVVYVTLEGGGGFRNRLKAYAHHHQVDLDQVPFGIVNASPNLLVKDDARDLVRAIEAGGGADVVVLDTLAQATPGGDENSAEDMGKALRHARMAGDALGALVVLVHHAGKDTTKGARGWSGVRAAADVEMEVARLESGSRLIRITKQKDGEDGEQWGFALGSVVVGQDEDGEDVTSCVVLDAAVRQHDGAGSGAKARRMGEWEQAIMDAIEDLGGPEGRAVLQAVETKVIEDANKERGVPDWRGRPAVKRARESLLKHEDVVVSNGYIFKREV